MNSKHELVGFSSLIVGLCSFGALGVVYETWGQLDKLLASFLIVYGIAGLVLSFSYKEPK